MPAVDTNLFPKVLFTEGSAPATPASGSQAVYIDSADHKIKRKDSSGSVTIIEGGSGGTSVTSQTTALSADVTMTSANTYYDGPSIGSLAAGTYFASGTVTFFNSTGNGEITAKLWDGTTVVASSEGTSVNGYVTSFSLSGIITLAGTGTIKISAAASVAAVPMKAAAPVNGAGNTACRLTVLKLS